MKISREANVAIIPLRTSTGTFTFSSYRGIVNALIECDELHLHPGEYVAEVVFDANGLSFRIERDK